MYIKTRHLFFKRVHEFFFLGSKRTVNAKKHITLAFLGKMINILIGFILVPLTINYVSEERYGIWLSLSQIIAWFSFFDIGLGNGLRNKLSASLAKKSFIEAKTFISSAYSILSIVFCGLILLFFCLNPFLNWKSILNTVTVDNSELRIVALISFLFFCLNYVVKLIENILLADQKSSLPEFIKLIGNSIVLSTILVLIYTTSGSLIMLSLVIGLSPFLTLLAANVFFFSRQYYDIRPSIKSVNSNYYKELFGLGVKFFIVQISVIIIFSTDNIIISQLFGPKEVIPYSLAYKYFGMITMFFSIITTPFWSAYTEAYVLKDFEWIARTNKSLIKIWILFVFFSIILFVISPIFYKFWVPSVQISQRLSFFMMIYVIIVNWGSIFVTFINGVGKIKLQMIIGTIGAILNIPLSIFFAKSLGMGSAGVIIASIICIGYGPFIAPIQYLKIINGNPKGIWNK